MATTATLSKWRLTFFLFPQYPLQQQQFRSNSFKNTTSSLHYRGFRICHCRSPDSNAESVRSRIFSSNLNNGDNDDKEEEDDEYFRKKRKKKRRRWWSNPTNDSFDVYEAWDDIVDRVWILKVFSSFGWWSPAIIISFLLSTGPKAFLMALAVPFGQSAISFAFEKFGATVKSKSKHKSRARRKYASRDEMEKEEEEASPGTRQGNTGYQSWVNGTDGSVSKGVPDEPSFGGWADLDRAEYMQRQSRMSSKSGRSPQKKGKLSRKERRSNTPLLLRLLIAVFPFLSSWTKML